jgi:hypothetical protein
MTYYLEMKIAMRRRTALLAPAMVLPFRAHALNAGNYGLAKAPTARCGVNQQLATIIRTEERQSGSWWFCGHAAIATAMNIHRNGMDQSGRYTLTDTMKTEQLRWFHHQFTANYATYSSDFNRQANIDWINKIVQTLKADEFSIYKFYKSSAYRPTFRDMLLTELQAGAIIVCLASIKVSGSVFGHFTTPWRINYQPATGGGTIYYFDPYLNTFTSKSFASYLDSMVNFYGHYSALILKKR